MEICVEGQKFFVLLIFITSFRGTFAISSANIGNQIMSELDSRFLNTKFRSEIWSSNRIQDLMKIIPQNNFQKRNYNSEKTKSQKSYNANSLIISASKEDQGTKSEEFIEEPTPPPEEIVWRQCSAKKLTAYAESNVKIRCALWAPLGSQVSWYKDNKLKFVQPHVGVEGQKLLTKDDFDNIQDYLDNRGRSKYEFHVVSLFYIDCVKKEDEGTYEIVVTTPKGNNYTRNFKLETSGTSNLYSVCCENCFYKNFFNPRIIDFAKTVIGKVGTELYLPCRPEITSYLTIIWNKIDRELSSDGYSITEQGDLKIHNLTTQDRGMYKCELYHNEFFIKYDRIQTFVLVLD